MRRSIRVRLTVWLAVLIALCLGAFALGLDAAMTGVLIGDLDQTLRLQARQVATTFDFGAPESLGDPTAQHVDVGAVDQFATAGVFIEVFDTRGRLLDHSSTLGLLRLPLPTSPTEQLWLGPHPWTAAAPGAGLRVYSLPVRQGGRPVGLVLVAASLHEVTAATRAVLALLLTGGLAVMLLTILGSSVLVRRSLRPLDDMAAVAEGITARHLDQRLSLRRMPREVGRLASTFNAMLDRLHDAFAAQRRFVADASHELRTPLATIRGRSDVLLLTPHLDAATREGLTLIREEAARMGRLVANLLLLARGDESRAIDRRPVELDLLLLEVAGQARSLALDVDVTISHEDQALVSGDADLLKQLLLNLVENAIAHTPPSGRVDLALTVAGGHARVSVRDTGPGIAPADRERIFARFSRLDEARPRRGGGAGLGLAIARWIAEAHDGHIDVESSPGCGSTFTIVLPLLPENGSSET